jgi:CubicO group peptidase (beta-lactamase class C family)
VSPVVDFIAWHGRTLSEHETLRNQWAQQGYRFVSLSVYGAVDAPVYAAVMIRRAQVVVQRDWPLLTAAQWQQTFDEQAEQGFGPVILAATGSASDPRFAAVFEPQSPIPLTRHGLTSGSVSDPATIQGMNNTAKNDGLLLRWAASYGTEADPGFAAIWTPNTGAVLWNNDGLLDDAGTYQARFDAETSVWCRPSFVTLNGDNSYLSLFVADEVGPWVARHDMTPEEYQAQFDIWTKQNYFPVCVQAAGADAASARFAALFVQGEETVAKKFTATGPVANAEIDAAVQQVMQSFPVVRQAALAIVHGTKLVYARGYTLAEPDWPVTQPTTFFRLASCSKTVTALAVLQLIEEGVIDPADTLQGILQLTTPSGAAPAAGFGAITIKNLLEHMSGLDTNGFAYGTGVVQAFGQPLPTKQDQLDSYIAGLALADPPPGSVQVYSNCGYYLLGRVVAHARGTGTPIEAYQAHLLGPLGITRIRSSVDLVSGQPADEARYQAQSINPAFPSDLQVDSSLQTPGQPLVASGYGDDELALTQGAGGLSGAVTDVARLVAILMDPNDNAALKRTTIVNDMLTPAAALVAAQRALGNSDPRAGYGLDDARDLGGGSFYGQKGGQLINAASVIQFDGEWGFVAVFDCPAVRQGSQDWYPNWPAVVNAAQSANWGSTDLFPDFGMPPL